MSTSETRDQEIAKKLLALRFTFFKQLPTRLGDIMDSWGKTQEDNWDWQAFNNLHRQVHTLTGSAPTFGFVNLGKKARSAETLIKTWISESHIPSEAERQTLKILLDELHIYDENEITSGPFTTNLTDIKTSTPTSKLPVYLLHKNRKNIVKLRTQLEQFNYFTKEFTSESELQSALDDSLPAALIMDISLTEGKHAGADLTKRLKQQYGETLPVILISKNNGFKTRLEAVRAGCDAYLAEPIDPSQLVDLLDDYVHPTQNEPYRILIVDDDTHLAEHYKLTLQQTGMEVSTLSNPQNILPVLSEVRPELIIMDVYMPVCSGQELAALIRQHESYLSIPIVFLSTEVNLDKQFKAMRMGGDDFLTKPINDHHLVTTVTIRAQRSRILNAQMVQDSLTGLLKHTKIKEQLAIEIDRAQRAEQSLSFAMLDIDNFKNINDTYGHMAGDRVIKNLARLLQQRLRKSDSIGRYGGEEFAVVLPSCGRECAINILTEIRRSFAELWFNHEGHKFCATVSIGIAELSDYKSAEAINLGADEALYKAKENGRNRIVVAGDSLSD